MAQRFSREKKLSKRGKVLLLLQDYEDNVTRTYYSSHQKKILCDWFRAHIEHPYVSKAEVIELGKECDLRSVQVKSWCDSRRHIIRL